MNVGLDSLFGSLSAPPALNVDRPIYAVAPISPDGAYFVGRDNDNRACVLIRTDESHQRAHPPIRLESLDVQFEVPSLLRAGAKTTEGTFTVIRCRSTEAEITRYFLSICETVIRLLGDQPTHTTVASAVNRLALIFQRLRDPPSRPVNGLFGELFLVRQCRSPLNALTAWRTEDASRFDFSTGDVRLEVKTASGRIRAHEFSYEQCNPPPGTLAVVASLFVERTSGGISLHELVTDIERMVVTSDDLVVKLHTAVASTLGSNLPEALGIRFDQHLAASSLQFFDLLTIPAIRGNQPASLSNIRFRSDLSGIGDLTPEELSRRHSEIVDFLPP